MDVVSELLTCPICNTVFSSPVTLACGHSFCKGCVDTTDSGKCECCGIFYTYSSLNVSLVLNSLAAQAVKHTQLPSALPTTEVQKCNALINRADISYSVCIQSLLSVRRASVHKASIDDIIVTYIGQHATEILCSTHMGTVLDTSVAILATLNGKPDAWVDSVKLFSSRFRSLIRARIAQYCAIGNSALEDQLVYVVSLLMQQWVSWHPDVFVNDFNTVSQTIIMMFHPDHEKRTFEIGEFMEWFKELSSNQCIGVHLWDHVATLMKKLQMHLAPHLCFKI